MIVMNKRSKLKKIKYDLRTIENSLSFVDDSSTRMIMKHITLLLEDIVNEITLIEDENSKKDVVKQAIEEYEQF